MSDQPGERMLRKIKASCNTGDEIYLFLEGSVQKMTFENAANGAITGRSQVSDTKTVKMYFRASKVVGFGV